MTEYLDDETVKLALQTQMVEAGQHYSDEARNLWLDVVQCKGLHPTIQLLGYPRPETGLRWMRAAGLNVSVHELALKAAQSRELYGANEHLHVLQQLLAEISERLEQGGDLSADEIAKLQTAISKNIETHRLVTGEVTSRIEQRIDPSAIEAMGLVEQAQLAVQRKRDAIDASGEEIKTYEDPAEDPQDA